MASVVLMASLTLFAGIGIAVFRRRGGDERVIEPRGRLAWVAAALATLGSIVLAIWPSVLGYPLYLLGVVSSLAAFITGGAALRPRGSVARGVVFGAAIYLVFGLVLVLVASGGGTSISDLRSAGVAAMWAVLWPGIIASFFGGFIG